VNMDEAVPFVDKGEVINVGGLSIEIGKDEILIHGSLSLLKDRKSGHRAMGLSVFLEAVATALSSENDLPEVADPPASKPLEIVDNPFG